ncbi:MAG: hypothetical protein AAFP22_07095 [Planctomycetota bacterium]
MGFGLGSLIGGVASVAGSYGRKRSAEKAAAAQTARMNRAVNLLGDRRGWLEEDLQEVNGYARDSVTDAVDSRARIVGLLDNAGRGELERIRRQRVERRSRARQDAVSRGLFSTSAGAAFERQVDAQSDAQVLDSSARFAGLTANADLAASGNVQAAMRGAGQMIRATANDVAQLDVERARIIAGTPVTRTPDALETLGSAGLGAAGFVTQYENQQQNDAFIQALKAQ